MGVFFALAIFTVITVAIGNVDLGHTGNVIVALLIAGTKASLVAAIFMHLKWEKSSTLWIVFALCAIFFVVLMVVPVLTANDHPPQLKIGTWS